MRKKEREKKIENCLLMAEAPDGDGGEHWDDHFFEEIKRAMKEEPIFLMDGEGGAEPFSPFP